MTNLLNMRRTLTFVQHLRFRERFKAIVPLPQVSLRQTGQVLFY